jgi:hypothetical protein
MTASRADHAHQVAGVRGFNELAHVVGSEKRRLAGEGRHQRGDGLVPIARKVVGVHPERDAVDSGKPKRVI